MCLNVQAQKENIMWSGTLITEGEWDMTNGKANWVNLLNAGIKADLWKNATLSANILAAHNLRVDNNENWNVANDSQIFSNILLDEKLPLSLFHLGITQQFSDHFKLFFGVRNMNMDYFISSYSSLFTCSSHGIFPTIAENWDVGNYPASALCLHMEWNFLPNFTWKNSFYNGKASTNWGQIFCFRPNNDGFINVTEIGYVEPEKSNALKGEYHLGAVYGNTYTKETPSKKESNYSVYGLIEQPLIKGDKTLGLLLEGGISPRSKSIAYNYYGAGIVAGNIFNDKDLFGVQVNRVLYKDCTHETNLEFTYNVPVMDHLTLQPALHLIRTNGENNTVGLIRAIINL